MKVLLLRPINIRTTSSDTINSVIIICTVISNNHKVIKKNRCIESNITK